VIALVLERPRGLTDVLVEPIRRRQQPRLSHDEALNNLYRGQICLRLAVIIAVVIVIEIATCGCWRSGAVRRYQDDTVRHFPDPQRQDC